MADGYLENHYAEYEKRKAEWLKKKKHYECRKDTKDHA
ncbi:MAG: dehydrogenase [Paludibacteraceae bacterium]|nr:dehydrogenase [Paludibacteraceae bacterium]